MITEKDNWQDKPGEGESSVRRDGANNSEGTNSNPWRKRSEGNESGSFDRPRKSFSDNNSGGYNRGGNSFDKPRRSFGESGNERPRRSFGEEGNRFSNNFDRPRRSFGEGDSERPRRNFGEGNSERPRRNFGDNGNRFEGAGRDRNSFDRPRRSYGEGEDHPRRSFDGNNFDRPKRSFGNSEGGDRPRRSFGEGGNRFGSSSREGGFDRPKRSFGEGNSDRPRRSFGEGEDRPRRSFGEGGNRFGNSGREGNSFDRPRKNSGDFNSERPRRPYGNNTGDQSRPYFSGPTLPRPERSDGRPRRPRIKREVDFDHGTPYGRSQQPALDPNVPIRLNKFLANAGICSRREADEFIQAGVVKVNGETVTELGVKVKPIDTILFHDQPVSIERKVYILLNKPKDCVTTSDDPQERMTVMDLVKGACYERIYPVGRLDRNTTGVLLLTNDGDLASKLTHPKFEKRKIYQVTIDKDLTEADFKTILEGITLDDELVTTDNLSYVDPDKRSVIGIEIHSGQNRVVRRIFESLGYKVYKLDRVYFAGLTKKNLPRGKWRHLTDKEVSLLKMGAFV